MYSRLCNMYSTQYIIYIYLFIYFLFKSIFSIYIYTQPKVAKATELYDSHCRLCSYTPSLQKVCAFRRWRHVIGPGIMDVPWRRRKRDALDVRCECISMLRRHGRTKHSARIQSCKRSTPTAQPGSSGSTQRWRKKFAPLMHKRVMRLLPLKNVIGQFLSQCKAHGADHHWQPWWRRPRAARNQDWWHYRFLLQSYHEPRESFSQPRSVMTAHSRSVPWKRKPQEEHK